MIKRILFNFNEILTNFNHFILNISFYSSRRIMSSLNPNANYEELVSVRLVGMMLTVIVRQELRKNVLRYSTQAVGTGALNFMV